MELSKNRDNYVREECEALEAAISFSTLLDDWKERLGRNLTDAAKMLIETKKFRVTGSRSAPVQVVGFGHVSGEKFSRGLILSLDSGIMPTQPFEGPFINPVHVPQMRKSVFEYEDLDFQADSGAGRQNQNSRGERYNKGKNAELLHEPAGAGIRKTNHGNSV